MDKRISNKKLALASEYIVIGYRKGLTLRELAQQYGCSPNTIRNLLIEKTEPLRKQGRRLNVTHK